MNKRVAAAIFAAVVLPLTGIAVAAAASRPHGFPVSADITGDAIPGKIKVGNTVRVTLTITGSGRIQAGIVPPGDPTIPANPSQRLTHRPDGSYTWDLNLGKGGTKRLSFGATVTAPEGASGPGFWCVDVPVAPTLYSKNPPAWTKTAGMCYRILAPKAKDGTTG